MTQMTPVRIIVLGCVSLFFIVNVSCADNHPKAAPGSKSDNTLPVIYIAPTPRAPEIDGVLDDDAWRFATGLSGFSILANQPLPANDQTQALITYDQDNLYIAVKAVLRGKKPRAAMEKRDSSVWQDDSIEVFISPPGMSAQSFYQFIVNAKGTIYDHFHGGKGVEWNGRWKVFNYVWDFEWIAEIAIPLSDLNVTDPTAAPWRFNVCRSYEQMTAWANTGRSYLTPEKFAYAHFDPSAPIHQIEAITGLTYGDLNIKGTLYNPSPQKKQIQLAVYAQADQGSKKQIQTKNINLLPEQKQDYVIDTIVKDLNLNTLTIEASEHQNTFYRSICPFVLQKFQSFTLVPSPNADELLMQINLSRLETPNDHLDLHFNITDTQGERLKQFTTKNVDKNSPQIIKEPIKKLPLGDYTITVEYINPSNGTILDTVSKHYSKSPAPIWYQQGRNLGHTPIVLPPWTPMHLNDNRMNVWARDYLLGDDTDFIFADIISRNHSLLNESIKLTAESTNGQTWETHRTSRNIEKIQPHQIIWTDTYTLGDAAVKCRFNAEYDGMVKVDLTLLPDSSNTLALKRLTLKIPLKPEYSKYCHYSFNYYTAGFSGKIPQQGITLPFANYIWLGGINKGLMWFSEGPLNWNTEGNALKITTKGLTVDFINQPTLIDKPRDITFGLIATPVRPMIPAAYAYNKVPEPFIESLAQPKAPLGNLATKMNVIWYSHGRSDNGKFITDVDDGSFTTPLKKNTHLLKNLVNTPGNQHRKNVFYQYFSGAGPQTTDFDRFGPLWQRSPRCEWDYNVGKKPQNHIVVQTCYNSCFADLMLYGIKRLVDESGIDGIYFDGMGGPSTCENPLHGCHAHKDAKGRKIPISPIFATREFHKRLATMLYEIKGDRAFVISHLSGCVALPILSFTQAYLDGESPGRTSAYGGPRTTQLTSYDYWLAHTQGVAAGLAPLFIVYTDMKNKPKDPEVFRGYLAMMMPHNVPLYILGDILYDENSALLTQTLLQAQVYIDVENAQFYGYWENQDFLEVRPANPDVVASFYHNKNEPHKSMVIVTNRSQKNVTITLEFALEKFGDLSGRCAYAVSDDFTIDFQPGNRITLPVKSENFIAFVILDKGQKHPLVNHPTALKR